MNRLSALHAQYDAQIPPAELAAARAARPIPIPIRLTGEALELRQTEASANMAEHFARDVIREMRREFRYRDSAYRRTTVARLKKEFRHHMLNCTGYRKIAASMKRRTTRLQQAAE